MIDIKAHIYSKLTESEEIKAIVDDNIHLFSDDQDEMKDFDERLPQITYARIWGTTNEFWIRQETMQISAWGKCAMDAENLARLIVELFNRTRDTTYRYCAVEHINDTYDRSTKAYGVHITARFTIYDRSF